MKRANSNETVYLSARAGASVRTESSNTPESVEARFRSALQPLTDDVRAVALAESLDRALAEFDIATAKLGVTRSDAGTVVFDLRTSAFRLFFLLDPDDSQSGWGLAFNRATKGGNLAGGSLEDADIHDVFSLVLKDKEQWHTLPASVDSEKRLGLTLKTS